MPATTIHSAVPLLLLPGLMNDERVWDPVVRALSPQRRIVVARTDGHDTVDASARAAIALAPAGRFAVAGFSLGGYVALAIACHARERIAGVALLDTTARADGVEARQLRQRMIDGVASGQADIATLAAEFLPRILHPSRIDDPMLVHLLTTMGARVGSEGFIRQQRAAMSRADFTAHLPSLASPALVLCGRDDQVTPVALSEEMAGKLPDVELVIVPECGHMATLERPDTVAQAMQAWCARVDAAVSPG